MRFKSVLFAGAVLCATCLPAVAYENFIPLGTGYSTDVSGIPALNSDAQTFTTKTDIYETELYRKDLEDHKDFSHLRRFLQNSDSSGSDSVDY
jgi:hypothetical protein